LKSMESELEATKSVKDVIVIEGPTSTRARHNLVFSGKEVGLVSSALVTIKTSSTPIPKVMNAIPGIIGENMKPNKPDNPKPVTIERTTTSTETAPKLARVRSFSKRPRKNMI